MDEQFLRGVAPGDLLITRKRGKMGELPYLITKLPHRMGDRDARRPLPCEALALVLGARCHEDEQFQDFLFVLCDDRLGWLSPRDVDRFLSEEEA